MSGFKFIPPLPITHRQNIFKLSMGHCFENQYKVTTNHKKFRTTTLYHSCTLHCSVQRRSFELTFKDHEKFYFCGFLLFSTTPQIKVLNSTTNFKSLSLDDDKEQVWSWRQISLFLCKDQKNCIKLSFSFDRELEHSLCM